MFGKQGKMALAKKKKKGAFVSVTYTCKRTYNAGDKRLKRRFHFVNVLIYSQSNTFVVI